MNHDLTAFLNAHLSLMVETVDWGNGRMPLQMSTYLSQSEPPLPYVTSVRAMVFQSTHVLVVRDAGQWVHILPGGRREIDETLEATLRREVLEETGWSITEISPLGFLHYHHLADRPESYAYPYPDFLQALYVAQADTYIEGAREIDGYELEARFVPITGIEELGILESQQMLLTAACCRSELRTYPSSPEAHHPKYRRPGGFLKEKAKHKKKILSWSFVPQGRSLPNRARGFQPLFLLAALD